MSLQCEATARRSAKADMGFFERYLSLWVALCIIAGIGLGHLVPQFFQSVGQLEIAQINMPVALLIWLMIIPMLLKIDLKALKECQRTLAWHRCHLVRQLGSETVLDGTAGLAVYRLPVSGLVTGRPDRQLYCRPDPVSGGALHRHGVRLEQPVTR